MRRYGCLSFLLDCIMFCITGGLWLIWIFVRESRRRKTYSPSYKKSKKRKKKSTATHNHSNRSSGGCGGWGCGGGCGGE